MERPHTENIYDDISLAYLDTPPGGGLYSVKIKDEAALIKTISTRGYSDVTLSFWMKMSCLRPNKCWDNLRVGWKTGAYTDPPGVWNGDSWDQWNELKTYTCSDFNPYKSWCKQTISLPPAAWNRDAISLVFWMDNDTLDCGCEEWSEPGNECAYIDSVLITGKTHMFLQEHRVDSTPPRTYKNIYPPRCGDHVTTDTLVELYAKDYAKDYEPPCAVGVKEIHYRIAFDENKNGMFEENEFGEWEIFSNMNKRVKFTFNEECYHKIEWYAVDLLGNQEDVSGQDYWVDDSPPVTTKTIDEPKYPSDQPGVLFNDDFESYQHQSGVDFYDELNLNGWYVWDYTSCCTPDDDIFLDGSSHPVNHYLVIRNDSYVIANIDTTGVYHLIVLSYDRWINHLPAGDYFNVSWRIGDSGPWMNLESRGGTSLGWETKHWVLDGAENQPLVQIRFYMNGKNDDSRRVLLDNVNVQGSQWVTTHTDITLTAVDYPLTCASGIKYIHYEIWYDSDQDGEIDMMVEKKDVYASSVTINFKEECLHALIWWAVDNLGHIEKPHVQIHKVDDTPPVLTKLVGGEPQSNPGPIWITTDTEISLSAVDGKKPCVSGLKTIRYKIGYKDHWSEWKNYEKPFTFPEGSEHTLLVEAIDNLGNTAEDEETFIVHGDSDAHVLIINPSDGDVIDSHAHRYVNVKIKAWYGEDQNNHDPVKVTCWLMQPYGAPNLYYNQTSEALMPIPVEWNEAEGYFTAKVPIYKYSDESTLNLWAKAVDIYESLPVYDDVSFKVKTNVIYDQWFEKGENLVNIGASLCDYHVENVFATVLEEARFIYEPETLKEYKFHEPYKGGDLQTIDPSKWYRIYMDAPARFYISNEAPQIYVTEPINDGSYETLQQIYGTTLDYDTMVKTVKLQITYTGTSENTYYWNGSGNNWQQQPVDNLCDLTSPVGNIQYWAYDSSTVTWTPGQTYQITAEATDMTGCKESVTVTFDIGCCYYS